jgi:hypothetical protein
MTIKHCIFCSKLIKANKIKSLYCSNSCKQKRYKLKKAENVKEIVKDDITKSFMREQEIQGWSYLNQKQIDFTNELEQNAKNRKDQDEIKEQEKEFQKGLEQTKLNKEAKQNKLILEMFLSRLRNNALQLKESDFNDFPI